MAGILFPRDEVKRLNLRANPEPSDEDVTGIALGDIQRSMNEGISDRVTRELQREANTLQRNADIVEQNNADIVEQNRRGILDQMWANVDIGGFDSLTRSQQIEQNRRGIVDQIEANIGVGGPSFDLLRAQASAADPRTDVSTVGYLDEAARVLGKPFLPNLQGRGTAGIPDLLAEVANRLRGAEPQMDLRATPIDYMEELSRLPGAITGTITGTGEGLVEGVGAFDINRASIGGPPLGVDEQAPVFSVDPGVLATAATRPLRRTVEGFIDPFEKQFEFDIVPNMFRGPLEMIADIAVPDFSDFVAPGIGGAVMQGIKHTGDRTAKEIIREAGEKAARDRASGLTPAEIIAEKGIRLGELDEAVNSAAQRGATIDEIAELISGGPRRGPMTSRDPLDLSETQLRDGRRVVTEAVLRGKLSTIEGRNAMDAVDVLNTGARATHPAEDALIARVFGSGQQRAEEIMKGIPQAFRTSRAKSSDFDPHASSPPDMPSTASPLPSAVPARGFTPQADRYVEPDPLNPKSLPRRNIGRDLADLWNAPRTIKSSFDVSAAGRQGLLVGLVEPDLWGKAWRELYESIYTDRKRAIGLDDYRFSTDAGQDFLAHSGFRRKLGEIDPKTGEVSTFVRASERDEMFFSSFVSNLYGVRHSEQGFAAFLNSLSIDFYAKHAKIIRDKYRVKTKLQNFLPEEGTDAWKLMENDLNELGKLTNALNGRANVDFGDAASTIASSFFSARFFLSRFEVHAKAFNLPRALGGTDSKYARKVATRTLLSFYGDWAAFVSFGKGMNEFVGIGFDVEQDPRSSDFGQARFGHQRIDPSPGIRPLLVAVARIGAEVISKVPGVDIGSFKDSRGRITDDTPLIDLITSPIEGRLHPAISTGIELWTGRNLVGEEREIWEIMIDLITPLTVGDVRDGFEHGGVSGAVGAGIPSLLGFGVNTYEATVDVEQDISDSYDLGPVDQLNLASARLVHADPLWQAEIEGIPDDYGTTKQELSSAFDNQKRENARYEDLLFEKMKTGVVGPDLGKAISLMLAGRFAASQALFLNPRVQEALDKSDLQKEDSYADRYWSIDLEQDLFTGDFEFGDRDEKRAKILEEAIAAFGDKKIKPLGFSITQYITGRGPGSYRSAQYFNPEVKDLMDRRDIVLDKMENAGYRDNVTRAWDRANNLAKSSRQPGETFNQFRSRILQLYTAESIKAGLSDPAGVARNRFAQLNVVKEHQKQKKVLSDEWKQRNVELTFEAADLGLLRTTQELRDHNELLKERASLRR